MVSTQSNPYSYHLVVDAIRIMQSDNSYNGEEEPIAYDYYTKSYLVEKIRGTTIFPFKDSKNPNRDCDKLIFNNLTGAGMQLYLYIILNLKWEKDYINLKYEDTSKALGISRVTLCKAIKQLESIDIICKKTRSEYWINPKFLFNGSVIKYANKQEGSTINVIKVVNKSNK